MLRRLLLTAAAFLSLSAGSPLAQANEIEPTPPAALVARRNIRCQAKDNAGQLFVATRKKLQNAQNAALKLCQQAGGQGCQIIQCEQVNGLADASAIDERQSLCALTAVSFANVPKDDQTTAKAECERLLGEVKNLDGVARCNVRQVQGKEVAQLRVEQIVEAQTVGGALAELTDVVQGDGLLADPVIALQVTNNGACQ